MSRSPMHADARAGAPVHARSIQLERRLARFQPLVQPRARVLAERHPRLADLALSFPALLFALAIPRAGFDPARAIARVIDGAPLREVAELARVPTWLRPVEPAAFEKPLPELPDGDIFRRQVANYLPRHAKPFDRWVRAVAEAHEVADQAVALWIARELHRAGRELSLQTLRGLSLWAWYARHAPSQAEFAPAKRWGPAMQYKAAATAAADWFRDLDLYLFLGTDAVADAWLTPATVDGYEFVPLRTAKEIADEAAAMRHCVNDYGEFIRQDESRVWSVRRDGTRIATLEVAARGSGPLLGLEQLNGVENAPVATELWLAAQRWLNSHDLVSLVRPERNAEPAPLDAQMWRRIWRPYWLAKRRFPQWLPLHPARHGLDALRWGERTPRRRRWRRH
jgi:hypothetical protein